NSTGPSAGETHRSNAGVPSSPSVTLTYVRLSGRIATRFCSPDSGGGEFVAVRACTSSSLLTGFARRTSGSPGAVELAANAFRVSGGPKVGPGEASGAVVPAALTFVPAPGLDPPEASTGLALGEACALGPARPGASRCTLRRNFIPKKPITKTSTPKMS